MHDSTSQAIEVKSATHQNQVPLDMIHWVDHNITSCGISAANAQPVTNHDETSSYTH